MTNGVESTHPTYDRTLWNWVMVRDAVEGEGAVKNKKEAYLPMPAAMLLSKYEDNPASIQRRYASSIFSQKDPISSRLETNALNPSFHHNAAYAAYLSRAQFPELPSFILRGLLGLTLTDEPTINLPPEIEYLRDNATPTGMSLRELYSKAVVEVLCTGKFSLILNVNGNEEQLTIVPHVAEQMINWKAMRPRASKGTNAHFIVFEEFIDNPDKFEHEFKSQYFVAKHLADRYTIEEYDGNEADPSNVIVPSLKGKFLNFIPFVSIGSVLNGLNPNPIPLYSVASSAMQIYMRSADLGNSQFISCNPTLVMTGVDKEDAPKALGSTVALIIPDEKAKVYYTETDTSALEHVMKNMGELYEQAVFFGAQLLDSSKKASESAETTRLKQASSGATLTTVIENTAIGFVNILRMAAEWAGGDPNTVEFTPIKEFMAPALTAPEIKAMIESWVSGGLSKFTLVDNFRRAGVLPAGSSTDDELARIASEIKETPVIETIEDNDDAT